MILSILLCEDDRTQRKKLEQIITNFVAEKQYDIQIALSTGSPERFLDHLEAYPELNCFYILDVDLQHEINGIALAKEIRERDIVGTIVFTTTHAEQSHIAFSSRIEMMDYIIKGSIEDVGRNVCECIELAYRRLRNTSIETEYFQVKTASGVQRIPYNRIICFEAKPTVPHKLIVHTHGEGIEFRGSLKDVESLSPDFMRCHKSYVVNLKHVVRVQRKQRVGEAELKNGMVVPVGSAKLGALSRVVGAGI